LDVAAGLGLHLPHLVRHQVGELGLVVGDELREAEEDLASLRRGHEPPLLERLLRRRDRAVDVLRRRLREDADRLAVRGTDRLERLAGRGVHPLPADEVLEALRRGRHDLDSTRRFTSRRSRSSVAVSGGIESRRPR